LPSDEQLAEANEHLELAKQQWDAASTAWWPPTDTADCVTKCFYAFENAVVAGAIALEIVWKKTHPDKIRVAKLLVQGGHVQTDISERLAELNRVRKDVSYGEPGHEMAGLDLEDMLSDLESYIGEIAALLHKIEEEQEDDEEEEDGNEGGN
jgi:hypothetical protein